MGSTSGQGTKILQATWHSQKRKKKEQQQQKEHSPSLASPQVVRIFSTQIFLRIRTPWFISSSSLDKRTGLGNGNATQRNEMRQKKMSEVSESYSQIPFQVHSCGGWWNNKKMKCPGGRVRKVQGGQETSSESWSQKGQSLGQRRVSSLSFSP